MRLERGRCDVENNAIQTVELSKTFYANKFFGSKTDKIAVRNSQFAVKNNECFGLLGQNGAGKSTTFKMLTGELRPTGGDAFVLGKSVQKTSAGSRRNVGYCPQEDALIGQLTPKEHLYLYGKLKGIPGTDIDEHVAYWLDTLDLMKYKNRKAKALSGGNKRKLNTAIALIGSPSVLFLDEPTTGMDPRAKRHVWEAVTMARNEGAAVVLTSHSMEECSALCTKMAIMFHGVSRCMGSVQRLQHKYGQGYTLGVSFPEEAKENLLEDLKLCVTDAFLGKVAFRVLEAEDEFLKLSLVGDDLSVVSISRALEAVFSKYNIESYDLSQSTLEDVFIYLGHLDASSNSMLL